MVKHADHGQAPVAIPLVELAQAWRGRNTILADRPGAPADEYNLAPQACQPQRLGVEPLHRCPFRRLGADQVRARARLGGLTPFGLRRRGQEPRLRAPDVYADATSRGASA